MKERSDGRPRTVAFLMTFLLVAALPMLVASESSAILPCGGLCYQDDGGCAEEWWKPDCPMGGGQCAQCYRNCQREKQLCTAGPCGLTCQALCRAPYDVCTTNCATDYNDCGGD